MAKKKVVTTEVTDDSELEIEGENSEAQEILPPSETDYIKELLEIGGDDVRWTVKRLSPGDPGYCATYSSSELSLDRIREDWGHGRYQIKGTTSEGKYLAARTVRVIEGLKKKEDGHSSLDNVAALLASKDDGSLRMMMQMMQMQNQQQMAAMKSQTDMLVAVLTRPPAEPPKQPSLVEIVGALAPFLKPEKSSGDSVEVLLRGLELGKELGADRDTGMADIAMKGLEAVAPVLQNAAEESKLKLQARVAQASQNPRMQVSVKEDAGHVPAIEQPPVTEKSPGEKTMFKKLQWLDRQLVSLLGLASRNKDPALYAEVFLDNLPDFISEDEIFERFSPEDAIETLIKYKPEIGNFKPWFEEFRKAVLTGFSEEGAEDGEDTLVPPYTAADEREDLARAESFDPDPHGENI